MTIGPEENSIELQKRTSPVLKIFYIDVDMNNPDLVIHPYIGSNKTINNFSNIKRKTRRRLVQRLYRKMHVVANLYLWHNVGQYDCLSC